MELTCDRCGRSSYVPDDLVQGRAFRAKCPDCEGVLEVPAERQGALDDKDLAWLSSQAKAPAPPPAEPLFEKPEVSERKVAAFEKQEGARRRRRALAIAAGVLAAAGLAGAALVLLPGRPGGAGPLAPRPRAERETGAAIPFDPAALLAKPKAEAPPSAPEPARPAPPRRKAGHVTRDDRKLLDLLAKKDDVSVVAPEGDAMDTAAAGLEAEAVSRTVAANRKAFDACVSKALRLNPNLRVAKRATLVLTVQPSGGVTGAFIAEEEVDRTDLGACLSAAARRMVFPSFEGEALDVSMPLSLSAGF